MKKITQWSLPDCSCIVCYSWDTNDHEDVRKHTIVSHKHCGGTCPQAKAGEQLEDSEFHKHHISMNIENGRA